MGDSVGSGLVFLVVFLCTSNARCYGAVPAPPEPRPALREACPVLKIWGNVGTRLRLRQPPFLIPNFSVLPARGSDRVAQALHRSSALSRG
jgi:hypothetical protein